MNELQAIIDHLTAINGNPAALIALSKSDREALQAIEFRATKKLAANTALYAQFAAQANVSKTVAV